ncbi:hypothetical protein A0H81_13526 [Grifola frondosa]|uniref:Uncharacterized protein n=1 Tax=Grifola frondosa TaxID=5627 RepID=A0A1C7LPM4_GRIFR|nr:hypothetical protein A0H81_13526 [Grifola frondosa]
MGIFTVGCLSCEKLGCMCDFPDCRHSIIGLFTSSASIDVRERHMPFYASVMATILIRAAAKKYCISSTIHDRNSPFWALRYIAFRLPLSSMVGTESCLDFP